MKMKKALAIIVTAALSIGTLAGCSQATQSYVKELNNAAKWESTTSDITGALGIDSQEIKEEIDFNCKVYTSKDNIHLDVKFNDPKGKINIPELSIYCDENTAYINKNFLEGVYTSTGQEVPDVLSNIKEEFIGTDITSTPLKTNTKVDLEQMKALANDPEALVKLIFGENNDLDLPFAQNGREYTINLDANQTVDLFGKAIKAELNNLDNLNNTFKLELTSDQIAEAKKSVNDAEFDLGLSKIKAVLNGSTIRLKSTFTDTSYTDDFNMNLQVKDFGKISFAVKSITTKTEGKSVDMPTSKIKLTEEEFDKLSGVSTTVKAIEK